jgi:hypothetical protein
MTDANAVSPDPTGTQVAFIQRGGALSQSISMDAGTYMISLMAAQRALQTSCQVIQVRVDGGPVGTITPTSIAYGPYETANFTVAAGTHTISFYGLNPKGGANTAFIDMVTIGGATGISDGVFSAPGLPSSTFQNAPVGSPWQFGPNTGVSANNSPMTYYNPDAPYGGQVGYIQRGGSMSQSVYLGAGAYSISMQAAQRAAPPNAQEIQVLVDGASVGTITPVGTSYNSYQTSNFTVTAGMHTIRFTGLNPKGGSNTAFLSEVAINNAIVSVDGVSNNIADGSFETPALASGTFENAPDGSPWQFGPGTGISNNNSAFTSGNSNAPDGNQVAFIQRGGSMSQSVYLNTGTYNLSLMAAQRENSQTNYQQIQVLVDGKSVGTITPSAIVYGPYQTLSFTVTTGIHAIRFTGLNPAGGANTAFIDLVGITAVSGISDGGFAAPGVPSTTFEKSPDGSPWQFGANTGVSTNASAFTSGNPVAPYGNQVAYIQNGGSMSQSVYLAAGTYTISLVAAQRYGQTKEQEVQVLVDGAAVGSFTPYSTSYAPYQTLTFPVTAAGMHTIRFTGLNPQGGNNTVFMSEVAVTPVTGIVDGSFEYPGMPTETYQYTPDGSPWQFNSGTGVSNNDSAFTSNNANSPDPNGTQVAFIQYGGSMSQSVYLGAGSYSLSLMAAQRYGQPSDLEIQVLVNGVQVGTITPTSTSYLLYQTPSFTANAGVNTIKFVALNPQGGANTAFIDLVTLTAAS